MTKSQKLLYTIVNELGGADDKIKLAKFQYFADFIHYAFHDQPISESTNLYEKRPYGPLSRLFNSDLTELTSSEGPLKQTGKYNYSIKKEVGPLLSDAELKTVRYVLD